MLALRIMSSLRVAWRLNSNSTNHDALGHQSVCSFTIYFNQTSLLMCDTCLEPLPILLQHAMCCLTSKARGMAPFTFKQPFKAPSWAWLSAHMASFATAMQALPTSTGHYCRTTSQSWCFSDIYSWIKEGHPGQSLASRQHRHTNNLISHSD